MVYGCAYVPMHIDMPESKYLLCAWLYVLVCIDMCEYLYVYIFVQKFGCVGVCIYFPFSFSLLHHFVATSFFFFFFHFSTNTIFSPPSGLEFTVLIHYCTSTSVQGVDRVTLTATVKSIQ